MYRLHQVDDNETAVNNGMVLSKGQEVVLKAGDVLVLGFWTRVTIAKR